MMNGPLVESYSVPLKGAGSGCILACGADIKNRFSFYQGGTFYFSQPHDNLESPDNFKRYIESMKCLAETKDFVPDLIAVDMHPLYFSRHAQGLFPRVQVIEVQHHHAHIASVLAAHPESEGSVIGVSFDGTGYGTDGCAWGGEFLVLKDDSYIRAGHFAYIGMPGAEACIREPWRMAFSLAYAVRGEKIFGRTYAFLEQATPDHYTMLRSMIEKRINTVDTSSCGRLFDAVASLCGIAHTVNFEAEAAIKLEQAAMQAESDQFYPFTLAKDGTTYLIAYDRFLNELLNDLEEGACPALVARKFHNSLAQVILQTVTLLSTEYKTTSVILSGGVFQNRLLCTLTLRLLKEGGFTVLQSPEVPVNDLGICIGQTYVAARQAKKECCKCA